MANMVHMFSPDPAVFCFFFSFGLHQDVQSLQQHTITTLEDVSGSIMLWDGFLQQEQESQSEMI